MHIPDGYLSPVTCGALYAGATPFWYTAMRRIRRQLDARTVPLLSVFAAFAFVIMMFNIPLPGGTTGHATGVAIASIVLGPWGSILAISVALSIQAVFFGDGGVTALGANCFNIAIVGSLAASAVYRMVAARSALTAPRRLFAASLAGYVAINLSALCAAIEFGIQPLFFKDASGAPLYAPYPLSIALPAMMIGHLTFAGLAELVVSGGVVAYLQHADPALLKSTAGAGATQAATSSFGRGSGWRSTRRLWSGVAALLILTPLGLLAAGSAWGEWGPRDFSDAESRQQISDASRGNAPPSEPPEGLRRLANIWTAPLSHYAPPFMRSQGFGYLMSAFVGAGLIIATTLTTGWFLQKTKPREFGPERNDSKATRGPWRMAVLPERASYLEKTVQAICAILLRALDAEELAQRNGALQRTDPRVKVAGLLALIIVVALARNLTVMGGLFGVAVLLAVASRIPIRALALRIWLAVLIFTSLIALPAIFLTGSHPLARVAVLGWPIMAEGLRGAAFLITRAETATTFAALLVFTTPWAQVLKALRVLRMPVVIVVILGMTYRYIFLFLQTALNMLESRASRMVGRLDGSVRRREAGAALGVLLGKTVDLSGDVYLAMQSRGFRGEVYVLDDFRMAVWDWVVLTILLLAASVGWWQGRS